MSSLGLNTNATSCNSSTLDPYVPGSSNPWNKAKVKHCYRRLGYGTDDITLNNGVNISPGNLMVNDGLKGSIFIGLVLPGNITANP